MSEKKSINHYDYDNADDNESEYAAGGFRDTTAQYDSYAADTTTTAGAIASVQSSSEVKPRILLMGLRKSGKSSIVKVVFHKMSPNETLFLESTSKIQQSGIAGCSFVNFDIWDFPGQINYFDNAFDKQEIFGNCGALVFVIDAQEETFEEALQKLHQTVTEAYKVNKNIKFEVFIHKVDGLSDDHKIERQDHIHSRAVEELAEKELNGQIHLSFHLTSIYDHSIFEAFSKVVQKLVPQMGTLEGLLDMLVSSCRLEKAFLIDIVSKLYIASDSSPVDMQNYELCADMIDVVVDISCIYGAKDESNPLAYDEHSRSIMKLSNGMVICLREMTKYLALVCLVREDNFDKHGVLEYNFVTLKEAISKVFTRPSRRALKH